MPVGSKGNAGRHPQGRQQAPCAHRLKHRCVPPSSCRPRGKIPPDPRTARLRSCVVRLPTWRRRPKGLQRRNREKPARDAAKGLGPGNLPAVGQNPQAFTLPVLVARLVPEDRKNAAMVQHVVQAEPVPSSVRHERVGFDRIVGPRPHRFLRNLSYSSFSSHQAYFVCALSPPDDWKSPACRTRDLPLARLNVQAPFP